MTGPSEGDELALALPPQREGERECVCTSKAYTVVTTTAAIVTEAAVRIMKAQVATYIHLGVVN